VEGLTHFNKEGRAKMVDVGDKNETKRRAIAVGKILMEKQTLDNIVKQNITKGDVLSVAQVAGIMGAKETSRLIPMCHNLFLTGVDIHFEIDHENHGIIVQAEVETFGKTGVEMEALSAVSITALTIYDMCKAIDKNMVIEDIKLLEKTGGKSGTYKRKE
jgi:cyclic pyranopterin monophosphate synthase